MNNELLERLEFLFLFSKNRDKLKMIIIGFIIISRIEFLYKHYNIEKRIKEKVKLNNKKLKYIIKQKEKGESSTKLYLFTMFQQGISIKYITII